MFRPLLRRRRGLSTWMLTVLVASAAVAVPPSATAAPSAVVEQASSGRPVVFYESSEFESMFVRGSNGTLWRRERDRSQSPYWGPWIDTGEPMRGDPAVERMFNGEPVVFWVTADGSEIRYQVKRDGAWLARSIPRPDVVLDSTPAVVAHNDTPYHTDVDGVPVRSEGQLVVFVRDVDGKLWRVEQEENSSDHWTEWSWYAQNSPALAGNPVAAIDGNGSIGVFTRDREGAIWWTVNERSRSGKTTQWSRVHLGLGPSDYDVAVAVARHGAAHGGGSVFQVFAANRQGEVWTATSQPSTPEHPRYTEAWTTPTRLWFDGQVQSSPVVASAGDGRMVVFGLAGADRRLVLKGQTALPDPTHANPEYHNGIWAAATNTPQGGDFSISAMSVLAGEKSRLEVYAMDTGNNLRFVSQLAAGSFDQPEGRWLRWGNLNPVGDPCANAGTMDCLTIASANPAGYLLDVVGHESASAQPPNPDEQGQVWQLVPMHNSGAGGLDGHFMIRNRRHGECLGSWLGDNTLVRHAQLRPCDASEREQLWFLLPVMPNRDYDPHSETPTRFRIGSVFNPNDCLVEHGGFWWCSKHTDDVDNDDTVWTLGRNGHSAEGPIELAMQYAANTCVNPNNVVCRFVDHSTSSDVQPVLGCVVGKVIYNSPDTNETFKYAPEWARGTGSEWSIGLEVGAKRDGLSAAFSINHAWVENESHVDRFEITVSPGRYGWLELRPVMRITTGHWQFSGDGWTWTVPAQVASFVGGQTVEDYVAAVYADSPPTQQQCPHGSKPTAN
jgi:hypothetical protein